MIRHDILHTIKRDRQHESFIYPYYGSYSIAEIPATVAAVLGKRSGRAAHPFAADLGTHERAILFFVDGFGFDHFIDYEPWLPFFHRLAERGIVYPITSVFPSTTPAALTTYHTGMTPQEHGLPEWTVYFEEFGEVIEPLPFRSHFTDGHQDLLTKGGAGTMLFSGTTAYENLRAQGVTPYVLISEDYAHSTYSQVTQHGAEIVPFKDAQDLFAKLAALVNADTGPAYFFVYWSAVDSTEHAFGPRSREHIAALEDLSACLAGFVSNVIPERAASTLFMLSSDHGQSSIHNEDIIYLNEYLDLENSYRISRLDKAIPPTGAPHDVFLHVRDDAVPAIVTYLSEQLKGKAEILTTDDAFHRGLFGVGTARAEFRDRIGTILILPYEGYHVWYRYAPGGTFGQRGIHGGLSQEEMIVPFAVAPLSKLLPEK
jgi:hypothetical protein